MNEGPASDEDDELLKSCGCKNLSADYHMTCMLAFPVCMHVSIQSIIYCTTGLTCGCCSCIVSLNMILPIGKWEGILKVLHAKVTIFMHE